MPKTVHFILNSPFPNYTGGRETWLYNVVTRLASTACPIRIYCTHNNELPQSFTIENPHIEILHVKTLMSYTFFRKILRSYLVTVESLVFVISMFLCMRRHVTANDIVVALGTLDESVAAIWLRHTSTCKFICSVRGLHAAEKTYRYPLLNKLWYRLERNSLQVADRIWCNGHDTVEYVRTMGFEAEFMPNGVDVGHYMSHREDWKPELEKDKGPLSDRKKVYIVSTATLLPIKGIKELIDAASLLKKRLLKSWQIVWVGKGDPIPYIAYAKQRGLDDEVVFTGERVDTAPYLRAAHIVACLSGGGGLSMAALEAMASGRIIVAWDSAVYRQLLIHNKSAFLIEENNSAKLADALEELIQRYGNYNIMGLEAQKAALPYDWDNVVKKVRQEIAFNVR
jgi:glycosyltransferase involved in cell wall biosynthesis